MIKTKIIFLRVSHLINNGSVLWGFIVVNDIIKQIVYFDK